MPGYILRIPYIPNPLKKKIWPLIESQSLVSLRRFYPRHLCFIVPHWLRLWF